MLVYIDNPRINKEVQQNCRCMINTQNPIVYLYANNEHIETKILKNTQYYIFIISPNKMKYLVYT